MGKFELGAGQSNAPGDIAYESAAGVMGCQGNLMFTLATGEVTHESVDRAEDLHRTLTQRYPQGYVHFMVTRLGAPVPNAEMRARLQKMAEVFNGNMLATAIVIEGDGLWAATIRMVLRTMSLAFKHKHPTSYFGSVEEALQWLEQQSGSEKHFRSQQVLELMGRASTSVQVCVA